MSLEFDATYRDGSLHPDQPLQLPENTPVRVVVAHSEPGPSSREEILAIRPVAPRFTAKQLDKLLDEFSISAPSLPDDFSRADLYSDHD